MDRAFSNRIESLSKRIDRLENNNNYGGNLRQAVQAEWTALNIDNSNKTIRVFHAAKNNWTEAVEICKENFGSLLHIESEEENQRISDMLRNTTDIDDDHKSPLYWIGEEAMATLILPPERYSNFDTTEDTPTEQHRGCAAVTAGNEGKWLSRDCAERHDFICQT
ncbi:lectin c-type domain-containing protein [Ditylenchus destructor]|uniref:Lectin c-type domain-containing protein n=1 Tax=Ditylenchus destructor TaxID=166010 RepID=A0AAD4N849_9BILA|nr:lectin c-type domain-containing protein [Ditylenchus destructor]